MSNSNNPWQNQPWTSPSWQSEGQGVTSGKSFWKNEAKKWSENVDDPSSLKFKGRMKDGECEFDELKILCG